MPTVGEICCDQTDGSMVWN